MDLTYYEPNPILKDQVDEIVVFASTTNQGRIGVSDSEDYNEDMAKSRSNFDIFKWLGEKGLNKTSTPENKRQTLLTLEERYSIPKMG